MMSMKRNSHFSVGLLSLVGCFWGFENIAPDVLTL